MRITDLRERTVPLSRYADPSIASGGLTTSLVAVAVEAAGGGRAVGFGFGSIGRFGQGGLIRERFAPRLLGAAPCQLADGLGRLEPRRAWAAMMRDEKPGGHGERCVAIGAIDMALWDAASKLAGEPLARLVAERCGGLAEPRDMVPVYFSGGYCYP